MNVTVIEERYQVIITTPGPQGVSGGGGGGGVTSFNGRTGAVTPAATDYTSLTNLAVPGNFTLTCAADSTTHVISVVKIGSEYVLQIAQ